jgi:predicted regulator of Ras-like GTPase activity (Roadblock/LC7/MglB family)
LVGVILASRDGKLIGESLDTKISTEQFVAMYASVMNSAENLAKSMDNRKLDTLITELENNSILIRICAYKSYLILIMDKKSRISDILPKIESYMEKINKNLDKIKR